MKIGILFISIICFVDLHISFSQSVEVPNVALKSHPTLVITRIDISEEKTDVHLRVENRITGGEFCADKNISLILPDGSKIRLISSSGIPACPDSYKFVRIGEMLDFILTFPPISKNIGSVDLVEECAENCFSFYGIILDPGLNKKIDETFLLVDNGEPVRSLDRFIKIFQEVAGKNRGAEGLLYLNIIYLSRECGNNVKAAEWYHKLESSGLSSASLYIKNLNSRGIIYQ